MALMIWPREAKRVHGLGKLKRYEQLRDFKLLGNLLKVDVYFEVDGKLCVFRTDLDGQEEIKKRLGIGGNSHWSLGISH